MSESVEHNINEENEVIEVVEEPTVLDDQFNIILKTLGDFKTQITVLQRQIRTVEKVVKKELKNGTKTPLKEKRGPGRKPSGFAKPVPITQELSVFLGTEPGINIARTDVTKFIIEYVKIHSLQNPKNRKIIEPDSALRKLLKLNNDESITYFTLQKHMNIHYIKE
jgi:upstream activation factor subunit UAF30